MERELQHSYFCDNMIRVLNERKNPGKVRCDRVSSKKSLAVGDKDSQLGDPASLTGTNLLNLNVGESITPGENEQVRRVDMLSQTKINETKKRGKGYIANDYTTIYSPNGQPMQKTPLNKKALQVHKVEHW